MTSAEKFEILSAYLDNEASDEECLLVKEWLENDPQFQQQYQDQLKIRATIRTLPANFLSPPMSTVETPVVSDSVTDRYPTKLKQQSEKAILDRFSLQAVWSASQNQPRPLAKSISHQTNANARTIQDIYLNRAKGAKHAAGSVARCGGENFMLVAIALSIATLAVFFMSAAQPRKQFRTDAVPGRIKSSNIRISNAQKLLVLSAHYFGS